MANAGLSSALKATLSADALIRRQGAFSTAGLGIAQRCNLIVYSNGVTARAQQHWGRLLCALCPFLDPLR